MIQILLYVIPFQGIFLSVLFLVRSARPPGPNFLMGLLLLTLSFLSAMQLFQSMTVACFQPLAPHRILHELLVSPFLFLYTSTLLRPTVKSYTGLHMLLIAINLLLLLGINGLKIPINKIIINAFSLINSMYLLSSLVLIKVSANKKYDDRRQLPASGYTWIVMLNLLVTGALSLSMFWYAVCPVRLACIAQLSKGLVIFYTYIKVLDKAAFTRQRNYSPF